MAYLFIMQSAVCSEEKLCTLFQGQVGLICLHQRSKSFSVQSQNLGVFFLPSLKSPHGSKNQQSLALELHTSLTDADRSALYRAVGKYNWTE